MEAEMQKMKTVIFCGGSGTRLREMTEYIPKPMVAVGGKPILWHLMKIYSEHGSKNFVLCLGYRGEVIKNYFLNHKFLANDFTINLRTHEHSFHGAVPEDWIVTMAETGEETPTGERLLAAKKYLDGEGRFFVTYGDGLAPVEMKKLLDFHKKSGKIATITTGRGLHRYGIVKSDETGKAVSFEQKPLMSDRVNIGFMVFEKEIFFYLKKGQMIEDVIRDLIQKNQVSAFVHEGSFHSMDTYRDYMDLNKIWDSGIVPWKIWKD